MELKNINQREIERIEEYYEHIQNLAHGLQTPTKNNFLATMFWVGL
jgi:hypothetical protein